MGCGRCTFSRRPGRVLLRAAALAAWLSAGLGGCVSSQQAEDVIFSPDGTKVAYVWRNRNESWMYEVSFSGTTSEYIGLSGEGIPEKLRTVEIRHVTRSPAFLARYVVSSPRYNPAGTHVAFINEGRIDVLDLATGKRDFATPDEERVSSFRWLDDRRIAYATLLPPDDQPPPPGADWDLPLKRKALLRHDIYQKPEVREELFANRMELEQPAFKVYWAPDTKSVLIVDAVGVAFLDLETGALRRPVVEHFSKARGVCWKSDSSAVFVGYGWSHNQTGPKGGFLIDRETLKVTDLSEKLREALVMDWFEALGWTADGRWIIVRSAMHTSLVRPDPWRVIRLEREIDERLPRYMTELRQIRGLRPGWLSLETHPFGRTYAIDYLARWIVPIADQAWALSPDKQRIAEVFGLGVVNIRDLRLPPVETLPDILPETQPTLDVSDDELLKDPLLYVNGPAAAPTTQPAPTTAPTTQPAPKKETDEDIPPAAGAGRPPNAAAARAAPARHAQCPRPGQPDAPGAADARREGTQGAIRAGIGGQLSRAQETKGQTRLKRQGLKTSSSAARRAAAALGVLCLEPCLAIEILNLGPSPKGSYHVLFPSWERAMPRESKARRVERTAAIIAILKREFPDARSRLHYDKTVALQSLVATILSAQCTDDMVNRVTQDLFRKYRTVQDFADVSQAELEKDIHATGFYRNKAKHIRASARRILDAFDGRVPETMDELLTLPGVARKTANCVLSNVFGKNEGVVVDTHVKRLANRLGLSGESDPVKIEADLCQLVPQEDWGLFSHLLIFHGRAYCTARKPDCPNCPLAKLCPSAGKV